MASRKWWSGLRAQHGLKASNRLPHPTPVLTWAEQGPQDRDGLDWGGPLEANGAALYCPREETKAPGGRTAETGP